MHFNNIISIVMTIRYRTRNIQALSYIWQDNKLAIAELKKTQYLFSYKKRGAVPLFPKITKIWKSGYSIQSLQFRLVRQF